MRLSRFLAVTAIAATAFAIAPAAPAHAQISTGISAGVVSPVGDFKDIVDSGYSVRGQLSISALLASAHLQVGWNLFRNGTETDGDVVSIADRSVFFAAVGARTGGLIFVGANAGYFSGDGKDGLGFIPEIGISLLKFEVVADARIDGAEKWFGLRAGLKF